MVGVPYLYRPGVAYVHQQTITARSDGTLVEALLNGAAVKVHGGGAAPG